MIVNRHERIDVNLNLESIDSALKERQKDKTLFIPQKNRSPTCNAMRDMVPGAGIVLSRFAWDRTFLQSIDLCDKC